MIRSHPSKKLKKGCRNPQGETPSVKEPLLMSERNGGNKPPGPKSQVGILGKNQSQ